MKVSKISNQVELEAVRELLCSSGLPVSDIQNPDISFFGFYNGDELIASAALEKLGSSSLLRSVAVASGLRGNGLGRDVVIHMEKLGKSEGLDSLYLLTEVPGFFDKLNYLRIERDKAPEAIKASEEFSNLCPVSAVLMKKDLR